MASLGDQLHPGVRKLVDHRLGAFRFDGHVLRAVSDQDGNVDLVQSVIDAGPAGPRIHLVVHGLAGRAIYAQGFTREQLRALQEKGLVTSREVTLAAADPAVGTLLEDGESHDGPLTDLVEVPPIPAPRKYVDPLEIDTFAARTLGFEPRRIGHIARYSEYRGVDISHFRPDIYELNSPEEEKRFRADIDLFSRFPCKVTAEGVCCTCRGNLVFALKRLSEQGLLRENQHFFIGKRGEVPNVAAGTEKEAETIVAVGDCAVRRSAKKHGGDTKLIKIPGCPPETTNIAGIFSAQD